MIMNAFRLDHKKKFCLTEWLEDSYDFLELDTFDQLLSIKALDSSIDI